VQKKGPKPMSDIIAWLVDPAERFVGYLDRQVRQWAECR
jgi:hypothetical protein